MNNYKTKKTDQKIIDEIKKLRLSGQKCSEIAIITGISVTTVKRYCKDIVPTNEEVSIDTGKVMALARARWPIDMIAKELRCSRCEIIKVLEENNEK